KRFFLMCTYGRINLRPKGLGQLYRCIANTSSASVHKKTLSPAEPSALEYIVPYRKYIFRQTGGFLIRNGCRETNTTSRVGSHILGIARPSNQRHHTIPNLKSIHLRPNFHYLSGHFQSGNICRNALWRRIMTFAL